METIVLPLTVPTGWTVPPFYKTASPADTAFALGLGAEAVVRLSNTIREEQNEETTQQLRDQHIKDAKRMANEFAAHVEQKERALTELQRSLQKIQDEAERKMSAMRRIVQERDEEIQRQHDLRDTMREQLKTEIQAVYQARIEEKDRQLLEIKEERKHKENEEEHRLLKAIQSLSLQRGASVKGKEGENQLEHLLQEACGDLPGYELVRTAQNTAEADFKMKWGAVKGLLESKNYDRPVPTKETEKFLRDIRSNPDIQFGLMISLNTAIVGHTRPGDIDIESVEDGRLAIFITNLLHVDDPIFVLHGVLTMLFKMLKHLPVTAENADTVQREERLRCAVARLTTLRNMLRGAYTGMKEMKQKLVILMDDQMASLQRAKEEEERILNELVNGGGEPEAAATASVSEDAAAATKPREKEECDICGALIARGQLPQHKKGKKCVKKSATAESGRGGGTQTLLDMRSFTATTPAAES